MVNTAFTTDQHDDGVLELTLTRADRRNTIDLDTAAEIEEVLQKAGLDKTVRALLITGEGRDFCTGAEVSPSATEMGPMDYRWATRKMSKMTQALWEIEKPVVSAVNGTVAGAGWMLALLADLVVAASGARWTHVFARRGMVPHAGDTYFLPRILPFHQLMELAFLSETVTSERLHEMGVINRLVEPDQVVAAGRELAARLAAGPTRSLGLAKRLYRSSLGHDMTTAFNEEYDATALLSTTADRAEGMRSLIEGRPPVFIGD
ncbi:MAG TPA: enoyl-CoA hydratase/isomerase family protein [Amycolatopsis sp.]|nr:enoyl-CoA hydratase/isomerase family protein [Amycolatopsis sp.]